MNKIPQSSKSVFKSVFIGILAVYLLTILGLVAGLPDSLPTKWWSMPLFSLDYPLQFLMPIAAFLSGYFASKNPDKWSRLFDGSVFLASYWWSRQLLFAASLYLAEPFGSVSSVLMQTVIPDVLPIILLGLYVIYLRKKVIGGTIGLRREFIKYTLTVAIATTLLQLASITKALILNNIIFNQANLSVNIASLAPFLSVVIVSGGYLLLRNITDPLSRWFLATIAATVYVFAAYSLIYLFGSMPHEVWLIVIGNVVSIIASICLLRRIKHSMPEAIVNR